MHSTAGTAQHSTAPHCISHSTVRHSTAQHNTAQHSTAQHSTAQRSTAQRSTSHHSTAQHNTALSSTALLNNTAQHGTTLNSTTISQHCTVLRTAQHSCLAHAAEVPLLEFNPRASAGVVVVHPLSCPAAQCPWRGLRASYSTPPWCLRSSSFAAWNFCDPHGPSTGLAPLFSPYYCLRGSCVCLTTRVGASTQSTSLESSSE